MPNTTDATWPDNLNAERTQAEAPNSERVRANDSSRLRFETALAKVWQALGRIQSIEKTIWSSPAGKMKLADRLVAMLPPHSTYVEPFAGSAAVLFAKEPAAIEVLNDADVEIASAYKAIKRLTSQELTRLQRMPWTGDREMFLRLRNTSPKDPVQKLHRFLYITHFSYCHRRHAGFDPVAAGATARTAKRVEAHRARLKSTRIYGQDYEKVVRKYDGKGTVFFFDPPYIGYNVQVGEQEFDEERFFNVLKSLKGQFLLIYGTRGNLPKLLRTSGYNMKTIRTPRIINGMRGAGGPDVLTQIIATNYSIPQRSIKPTQKTASVKAVSFTKSIPLIKNLDPNDERFVMGIVLEPEVVDAQGHIYSETEIRQAAHRFMENAGDLGLMHERSLADQVKILETYLAPSDISLGNTAVRKGTWLLAVRILSDRLWQKIRAGEITGFSIGGSARQVPETSSKENT